MVQRFRSEQSMSSVLYSRTIANYVFDAIARRAMMVFAAEPSVHVRTEAQTVKFFFKGSVLARFKKASENGMGCNIPTQAVLAFEDAEKCLPGLPPETAKVEFIWEPNELWTQLENVLVVARDGDRLLWQYDIPDAGAGTVVALPLKPRGPSGTPDAPLITPKKPKPDSETREG
jgi:hypothetical protein